jgi:ATP-dependent Zn protease
MANNKFNKNKKNNILRRFPFGWILGLIIFFMLINSISTSITGVPKEISYSDFYKTLKEHPEQVKSLTKTETVLQGELTDNSKFFVNIPEQDPELLNLIRQNLKNFDVKPARTFWATLFFN